MKIQNYVKIHINLLKDFTKAYFCLTFVFTTYQYPGFHELIYINQ
jgi:hypothetical protein